MFSSQETRVNKKKRQEKLDNPNDVIKKITSVKLSDIQRVAKEFLSKKPLNLALIGDFEDKDKFLKLLA